MFGENFGSKHRRLHIFLELETALDRVHRKTFLGVLQEYVNEGLLLLDV